MHRTYINVPVLALAECKDIIAEQMAVGRRVVVDPNTPRLGVEHMNTLRKGADPQFMAVHQ